MIKVSELSSVLKKRIRIKTIWGRPINGVLKEIDKGMITLDSQFKTGKSILTIPIDKISSVELL
jgi:small nuclear ribonucleoprotein (snRNP)-like protein